MGNLQFYVSGKRPMKEPCRIRVSRSWYLIMISPYQNKSIHSSVDILWDMCGIGLICSGQLQVALTGFQGWHYSINSSLPNFVVLLILLPLNYWRQCEHGQLITQVTCFGGEITHSCLNFHTSLPELSITLGHGWVIISHSFMWMY